MKIEEISSIDKDNKGSIYFHKMGLFWRSYNKSAYLLLRNLKKVQLKGRHYKNINDYMLYTGIPHIALERLREETASSYSWELVSDTCLQVSSFDLTLSSYQEWFNEAKENLSEEEDTIVVQDKEVLLHREVIDSIKKYPLLYKSPFEAQQFIAELQKRLNGITS